MLYIKGMLPPIPPSGPQHVFPVVLCPRVAGSEEKREPQKVVQIRPRAPRASRLVHLIWSARDPCKAPEASKSCPELRMK